MFMQTVVRLLQNKIMTTIFNKAEEATKVADGGMTTRKTSAHIHTRIEEE